MVSKMVTSNECLFLSFLRRSNFIKTNNSILLDPLIEHKIPQIPTIPVCMHTDIDNGGGNCDYI